MNPRVKKFISYYRPYRRLFFATLLCALLVAGIALALPLCIRYITKNVLAGGGADALRQVWAVGGLMVALLVAQTALNFFVDYQGHAMGARMERDMRAELFDHLTKLSFRFYDQQRTGQLMSRITHDLLSLAELYHHGPEDYLIYSVKFIGALVILLSINVPLTLAVFAFLPVLAVFSLYVNRGMHAAMKRAKERMGDINAQVEESLAGIRVVQSFGNEAFERQSFARENNRFLESREMVYRSEAVLYQGVQLLTSLITVAVVVVGGAAIARASLDLADMITFLLYVGSLVEPVQKLTHMTQQFQEGVTGFERFMEILEIAPEITDAPGAVALAAPRGRVTFHNVRFRYGERGGDILKSISLEVRPGETVALVGSSGVGKTTLCSLVPRFYEVTEGEIRIDGVNIRNVTLASLRRSTGVVQQDVYLFSGTVLENIRYGKPGASEEEVVAAAKRANAHDFIAALPNGYHTEIGQRGVRLSGGQRQRLSIARVFLKDPPILIFDEATSALDSESERVVQESLEALARDRTTFIIAHRLSTIRNAPRIVVLTGEGIEEEGTHEELMARGGVYARFYALAP